MARKQKYILKGKRFLGSDWEVIRNKNYVPYLGTFSHLKTVSLNKNIRKRYVMFSIEDSENGHLLATW